MADSTCAALLWRAPVRYTRHAQRAFLLLSGLRNMHSPNIRRLISLTVYRLKHGSTHTSKLSFASGTVCPSTPGAESVAI